MLVKGAPRQFHAKLLFSQLTWDQPWSYLCFSLFCSNSFLHRKISQHILNSWQFLSDWMWGAKIMARITSPYFCRISHFDISYIFMQSGPKHSTAVFWHYNIPHYCKHIKKKLINCNIFPLHSPWYWRLKPEQTTLEKTFPNEIPWMNIFGGFFYQKFTAICCYVSNWQYINVQV